MTERFGLFSIIIFGELIANSLFFEEEIFGWKIYLIVFFALLIAFALQWYYFDIVATNRTQHALERHPIAGQVWAFVHVIHSMGVVICATGLHLLTGREIGDKKYLEAETRARWYYCGGLAAAILGSAIFNGAHKYAREEERVSLFCRVPAAVILAVCVLLLGLWEDVSSLVIVGLGVVALALVIAIEEIGGRPRVDKRSWLQRTKQRFFSSADMKGKKKENTSPTADGDGEVPV